MYNNGIRSIRTTKKWDFKENIFIMLQCITNNSKFFEEIGNKELHIDTSIELSERINLFLKQNTYFLSKSPNDLILSCTNISLALLYFGMPKNLRRLLLYAILDFLIALTVPLYHIVEQYIIIITEKIEKAYFTSGEHLQFINKILMSA